MIYLKFLNLKNTSEMQMSGYRGRESDSNENA